MNTNTHTSTNAQDQQAEASRYAVWLDWGSRLGVIALVLSFIAYIFGILTPLVPLEQLPQVWGLSVTDYLEKTGSPSGWAWLTLAGKGDFSNLIGIAILTSCSMPPLLGLLPLYLKRRDYLYAGLCASIVLVLVLAASGLFTGAH